MTRAARALATALYLGLPVALHVPDAAAALTTTRVASGLLRPVFVTAPAGDDRLFIVEQWGRIRILKDGVLLSRPFLDINAEVVDIPGEFDERGLLGLAFHPDYAQNGRFFVYYIDNQNDSRVVEHTVSSDPDSAIASPFQILYEVDQPFGNHKGGTLAFRPTDGYLYVGLGDGGSGGDPDNRAMDPADALGKFLRFDVDLPPPYIPAGNPYVGNPDGLDEIWSLGFRNPYRWSFDRLTGDLYIGDVGQECWEEIDVELAGTPGGRNYGWSRMEGAHCFNKANWGQCSNPACTGDTLTLPAFEYAQGTLHCAVTGGNVYRGTAIPGLGGTYFFADFCSDSIWSFRYDGASMSELQNRTLELAPGGGLTLRDIVAFGEDGEGELYLVDRGNPLTASGEVYMLIDDGPVAVEPSSEAPRLALTAPFPNPGAGAVRFEARLSSPGRLVVEIVDAAGRTVVRLHDGAAGPGPLSLVWDGRDAAGRLAPSGVYYVRAASEDETVSRQLTRLRR
jgi:glucose/arabinose dehydrogenase